MTIDDLTKFDALLVAYPQQVEPWRSTLERLASGFDRVSGRLPSMPRASRCGAAEHRDDQEQRRPTETAQQMTRATSCAFHVSAPERIFLTSAIEDRLRCFRSRYTHRVTRTH